MAQSIPQVSIIHVRLRRSAPRESSFTRVVARAQSRAQQRDDRRRVSLCHGCTARQHRFLTYDDKLPEAILVGIAYGSFAPPVNRRDTDFGPGAEAFQRFLKEELMPQVERRTRADSQRRILVGQSRGGGFVLYSAFTEPELFWGRIASNPSYLAYRPLVLGPTPARGGDVRLAVASGTRDRPQLRQDALAWFGAQEQRPGPWAMKRIDIEVGAGTRSSSLPILLLYQPIAGFSAAAPSPGPTRHSKRQVGNRSTGASLTDMPV
jgi:predicted esterase